MSHIHTDGSPTADPVFYRTYSRRLPGGDRETWEQAVERAVLGLVKLGKLTPDEAAIVRSRAMDKVTMPSGRWLWVGGTHWIENARNYSGAYNCTSTNITDWRSFGLLMDLAMMGSGTGAVLEPRYIKQLPRIANRIDVTVTGMPGTVLPGDRQEDTTVTINGSSIEMVVGDSRQGWVDSYQAMLELASMDGLHGQAAIAVDLGHVRAIGEPLKGFGGVANPVKLPELYSKVARILNQAIGRRLTSVECCLLIDEAAIVVVAGNIRRCLPSDALVHTINGLIPIQAVQVGDLVQTPIGFRRVTNKFDQGMQDVYKIETNATPLRSTLNHRHAVFSSIDGEIEWKPAHALSENDRLVYNNQPLPGIKTYLPEHYSIKTNTTAKSIQIPDLTPDIAWLIGYTHGNGHVSIGRNKHNKPFGCVSWSMNASQPELMAKIREKIDRALALFELTAKHSVLNKENTGRSCCSSIRLTEYFYLHVKQSNRSLQIPNWILSGSCDIRASYLAGLVDSDGSLRTRPPILVTTIHQQFVLQVGSVLASLGIAGRIKYSSPQKENWRLKYCITIPASKSSYNQVIAPYSLKGKIHEGVKMYGFNFPGVLARKTYAYSELHRIGFSGSHKVAINYESYVDKTKSQPNIPVTVKSVEFYDHVQTYDIEVEDAGCFYADGFLTHNSAGMRQFDGNDALGATAKDNLWQQGEDGNWRIDPDRDALRMANHTRVFHRKPTEAECIAAVRKQFFSGEGAIQWAGEAIARANADLLLRDQDKVAWIGAYEAGVGFEALRSLAPNESDREIQHRIQRFGLNPCLAAETIVPHRLRAHGVTHYAQAIELVKAELEVWVCDREGDWIQTKFGLTNPSAALWKLDYLVEKRQGTVEFGTVFVTGNHQFFDFDSGQAIATESLRHNQALVPSLVNPLAMKVRVLSCVKSDRVEPVYCCTVPTTHSFDLEHLHSHNCGEIIGDSFHCNLSEVHLNLIDPHDFAAQDEAFRAGAIAAATLLHHQFSEERYQFSRAIDPIVGVSFTGLFDFFVQAFGVPWLRWWEAGRPRFFGTADSIRQATIYLAYAKDLIGPEYGIPYGWMDEAWRRFEGLFLSRWRRVVHETVWDYCDRHGLRRPNRCTTTQPAGTKSLLTGASPGWHPPKAARFIRRITFRKNDPVALACMDYGYSVVPSQSDKDERGNLLDDPFDPRCTEWLVEIPVAVTWADLPGADAIAIEQFSALAQFDFYMQVQRHYTAHNCFARETRFLTMDGVRSFDDFEPGDVAMVLNRDRRWVPARVVMTDGDREMVAIELRHRDSGKHRTITATLCHRFPVWRDRHGKPTVLLAVQIKEGNWLATNDDGGPVPDWLVFRVRAAEPQVGWCVMEPETEHFTLAGGVLTMNTSATIELREDEVEPLGRRIHQAIANDEGYISAALLARFDAPFPRLPFEKIDRDTYDRLMAEVRSRRRVDDFHRALRDRDTEAEPMLISTEQGPAGCDSDKCLLPENNK